ncbi:putative toxin-antitoxin system toxin component, PIN family [Ottowia sp. GY511]|nr:putative toxin-antitoxin system toxin component, PIN family [Ottowia sp. GY511]
MIDTNCVLDLWVFQDPGATGLLNAVTAGRLHWCATLVMREELARVLGYPQVERRLGGTSLSAQDVLAKFDAHAHIAPPPPTSTVRCRDADDQVFIDLAVQHRAILVSKDARVIELARRLAPWGVAQVRPWPLI